MTIDQLINEKLQDLTNSGIETSKFELRLLAAFVLQLDLSALPFYKAPIEDDAIKTFNRLADLRKRHCPMDKIIGSKGFYKHDFIVNADVLSPRADTEILTEAAIDIIKRENITKVLEFGVGSGCIIASVLADCPSVNGTGIDISEKALNIAKLNAEALGIKDRLALHKASWFDGDICQTTGNGFEMIVSNPPYIPSKDIDLLDEEVKNYDPVTALDGGADGLRDYRRIAALAETLLKPGGWLLFEAGIGQADDIINIAQSCHLEKFDILKDLGGIDRCIILKKQFTFSKV